MGIPRLDDTLGAKPWRLKGSLAVGESLLTTVVAQEILQVNGASAIRVRFEADKAGTLYVALVKNDKATEETDPAPRTIPVLDATEVMVEFDNIIGESFVLIKFTAGAATSVITYCDLYRSFNPQTEGQFGGVVDDMVIPGTINLYAPEEIYLNRDWLTAGVAAASDLAHVSELQVVIKTLIATSEIVVDLLVPGGDPETAGDWLLDMYVFDAVGVQTVTALSRWHGVRIRGKSGGTGGTGVTIVRWWN